MERILYTHNTSSIFTIDHLCHLFSHLESPNNKVTNLVHNSDLIRIRRGLYALGELYRNSLVSKEVLANLIYGPSYITADYALMVHGLILERVFEITSVCLGKSRSFHTPFGWFHYRQTSAHNYSPGISLQQSSQNFLLATPERALIDKIQGLRSCPIRSQQAMATLLFDDLRIDKHKFQQLDYAHMKELVQKIPSKKPLYCLKLLKKFKKREEG